MKCIPNGPACPLKTQDEQTANLLDRIRLDPTIQSALDQGEIDGVLNAETGTTDLLEQARQGLLDSESRHRTLISAISSAAWTTDATGQFITPQWTWMEYTGQSQAEARGYGWAQMLHPEDRERILAEWKQACQAVVEEHHATGRVWHAASQSYHFFEVRSVPHCRRDGQVLEWVGSLIDINDRILAEQSLRLAQRALEASVDPILISEAKDGQHPIVYVNPAFEKLTGYSTDEVLGRDCRFLQGNDTQQPGLSQIREALEHNTKVQVLLRNYRKDGTLFWNDLRLSPVEPMHGDSRHFVGVIHDVSENLHYQDQLKLQATHDMLTGLANRILMEDRLNQEITHASRNSQTFAVVFMDLDHFKVINDSLGHAAGDKILRTIAHRLNETVRSIDTIARYGGDEFVLILPGTATSQSLREFCGRLARTLRQVIQVDGHSLHINTSIGIALYPLDGQDGGALLKKADAAMYRAKELGRNRVQFASEAINQRALQRFETELQLRVALQRGNELFLHYQPQLELSSGRIVGFEALVRWKNTERGRVFRPDEFIPVAEQSGLIVPLGEWVLRRACEQLALWTAAGHPGLRMSINLSARQLTDNSFIQCLGDVLASTPIAATQIEIELTETAVLNNTGELSNKLDQLRQLGVRLAIDDFGTGYASLSQLKQISFDTLKLDKNFIDEITTDPQSAAIARMVMGLARSMCIPLVAEGVETEAQLRYLQRCGCELGQGYYFSKPVTADRAGRLLTSERITRRVQPQALSAHILLLGKDMGLGDILRQHLGDELLLLSAFDQTGALNTLAMHDCSVVIATADGFDGEGTALFSSIRVLYPQSLRVLLHESIDNREVQDALNQGWYTHCLTPKDIPALAALVRQGLTGTQPLD